MKVRCGPDGIAPNTEESTRYARQTGDRSFARGSTGGGVDLANIKMAMSMPTAVEERAHEGGRPSPARSFLSRGPAQETASASPWAPISAVAKTGEHRRGRVRSITGSRRRRDRAAALAPGAVRRHDGDSAEVAGGLPGHHGRVTTAQRLGIRLEHHEGEHPGRLRPRAHRRAAVEPRAGEAPPIRWTTQVCGSDLTTAVLVLAEHRRRRPSYRRAAQA